MVHIEYENPFGLFYEFSEKKAGYIRADYDKGKWWNTVTKIVPVPDPMAKEFDYIYDRLIERFPNIKELEEYCRNEPKIDKVSDTEYNLYAVGSDGMYWIRIKFDGDSGYHDYNLYINGYLKKDVLKEPQEEV